ncbi:Tetratricopeptide repeat protein [Candidatus Gugararchaeum adminiculabundum]|nr:Tetratricopeptide repeat protein [Candidatus Gugararchaeum adminiculabundum]
MAEARKENEQPLFVTSAGLPLFEGEVKGKQFVMFRDEHHNLRIGKIQSVDLATGKAIVKVNLGGGALKDLLRGFRKTRKMEIDLNSITGVGVTKTDATKPIPMNAKIEKVEPRIEKAESARYPELMENLNPAEKDAFRRFLGKADYYYRMPRELAAQFEDWEKTLKAGRYPEFAGAWEAFKKTYEYQKARDHIREYKKFRVKEGVSDRITAFTARHITKDEDVYRETAGSKRIHLEVDRIDPEKAGQYARKYNELVSDIVSVLRDVPKGDMTEENFIVLVWGVINSNLNIVYGTNQYGFLNQSIRTGKFDCDTSAFLVYDIAKRLGVEVQMVATVAHALLKTRKYYFETTNGRFGDIEKLGKIYKRYIVLSDEQVQSITYTSRGNYYNDAKKDELAMQDFAKAVQMVPESSSYHNNLGVAYDNRDNVKKSNNRGVAYSNTGNVKKALEEYDLAIKLDPENAIVYKNRAEVYSRLGEPELVKKDLEMYYKLKGTKPAN